MEKKFNNNNNNNIEKQDCLQCRIIGSSSMFLVSIWCFRKMSHSTKMKKSIFGILGTICGFLSLYRITGNKIFN
jgi:hypothetical protein